MDNTLVPLQVAILKYQYDTEQMILKDPSRAPLRRRQAPHGARRKHLLIQFIVIYGEILNIQRIDNKLFCNQLKLNNINFNKSYRPFMSR